MICRIALRLLPLYLCQVHPATAAEPGADPPPGRTPDFSRAERHAVPLADVVVADRFWAPRLQVYRERTIPHSWTYVSREIEDNEIAAGWKQIPRAEDTPWNQANLFKVMETVAYALAQDRTPELETRLDGVIRAVAAAQQANGYVNALITVRKIEPWTNLDGRHEGYVAGHLIEAAVGHFLATGKTSFLDVARRLADHIHRHFVLDRHEGVCGHAGLEPALVRLYRVTGETRYLDLAREWIERRGKPWAYSTQTPRTYFMDHLPIRQVPEVTGHAVRTLFYLTGVAGVAVETADPGLAEASRRLWQSTTRRKMYVTGSAGSQAKDEGFGPDYELPNDGYCESCAACGLVTFAHAMFLLDGESDAVDVLERSLYNAVLHGVALDGTSTYYRNPLTDENRARDNCWVCCPPCLSRTLLRLPDFIYARTDSAVYVNLYVGSRATVCLPAAAVHLSQDTDYPWDGTIRLRVQPEHAARFTLLLRRPAWCEPAQVRVTLDDQPVASVAVEQGYLKLEREWSAAGHSVRLELPMPPQRLEAHPKVEADRGRVAVQRGPLVYAFEGLDNGGDPDVLLAADPGLQAAARPDLMGGLHVVTGTAADGRQVTAVPFYALANRAPSRQVVWVRQAGPPGAADGGDERLYRPFAPGPR